MSSCCRVQQMLLAAGRSSLLSRRQWDTRPCTWWPRIWNRWSSRLFTSGTTLLELSIRSLGLGGSVVMICTTRTPNEKMSNFSLYLLLLIHDSGGMYPFVPGARVLRVLSNRSLSMSLDIPTITHFCTDTPTVNSLCWQQNVVTGQISMNHWNRVKVVKCLCHILTEFHLNAFAKSLAVCSSLSCKKSGEVFIHQFHCQHCCSTSWMDVPLKISDNVSVLELL